MNTPFAHSAESVTRRIAQWGSLAAASLFGLAFVTDSVALVREDPKLYADPALIAFTGFVALTFVGYAIAWRPRWETLGSVIALLSILGAVYAAYVAAV